MDLNFAVLSLVALFVAAAYRFLICPTFISPLSKIPNAHWSSPICPLWILWKRYCSSENRSVHNAHLKFGHIVRLAPNELSINDVDGLRTIYAGGYEKGQWYSIFDNYGVPCMFSAWYSRTHSARKRMVSNIYSKSVLHSSPALARQAQVIIYDRLLPILTAASTSPTPSGIDIHEIWNATTMDFITAYQFGLSNGSDFLQNEPERRTWLSFYHSRKTHTFFNQELPKLTRFLRRFHVYLCPTWVDDANGELEAWCEKRCKDTTNLMNQNSNGFSDVGDQPMVVEAMTAGISKENKARGAESVLHDTTLKYPELSIASEMIDHLAAGHETSGITLTYIAWNLSQDLALQDKLRKELLTLSPNMALSLQNSDKIIPNSKELDALPILHAVVMETLRLHAAIPGGQPRMTPYPSSALGPYNNIPGGVRVQAQAYSIHRDENAYPNPEKWDYMRWVDDENGYTEQQKKERDRWFWAFSSGGRMCVGSNFAMHEMKLVIAAVYSNFRTHIVNDEGIEQTDGYTCGPASNRLILKFERV